MPHQLRLFLIALQFFTRLPVPRAVGYEPAWLHASARWFAAVGLVVGALTALAWWLAALLWPPAVAVGIAVATGLLVTGGFHEDGLADTFDGLGGAAERTRALAIMKDSRLGTYGALALLVVLGLKVAALLALGGAAGVALLFAHCASRAVPVALLAALPYAGDPEHAKAKPMAQQADTLALLVNGATVAAAAAAVWAWQTAGLPGAGTPPAIAAAVTLASALAAAALAGLVVARWLRRRLGGYTGDGLGASQQLSELALLLGWLATV